MTQAGHDMVQAKIDAGDYSGHELAFMIAKVAAFNLSKIFVEESRIAALAMLLPIPGKGELRSEEDRTAD